MTDEQKRDFETIRMVLRQLPQEAREGQEKLLRWVDELEGEELSQRESFRLLLAENERLKQEIRKLRLAQSGIMSSRLKDALRE